MTAGAPETPEKRSRSDERRWLLGLSLVTACSWGRWLATGSPKVDESYPSEKVGLLLFVGLIAGWGVLVAAWRGMLAAPPARPRVLAFAGLLVASTMLPMLSNDVYSVLGYGSLAARGHDVYATAGYLPQSVWYSWMGERWRETVCVYGPTTLVAAMPAALAGSSPWLALILMRLAWLGPLAVVMEVSFRRLADRPFFHAMVWLNPLWLVQGPGQLHADLLGVVAITAGILVQRGRGRGATWSGWVLYSVAALGKYSFGLAGVWFWLVGARTPRERILRIPALVGVLTLTGGLFYAPFWRGAATVTEPIRALSRMNPGGTLVEVAGILVQAARTGTFTAPDLPARLAVELDRATKASTWQVASLIMGVTALGVGVRVLREMLRKPSDEQVIALGTGTLLVAALTLAAPRFQSWYLVAPLPFFGLACTPAWQRWWVAAVAASVAVEFVQVLPRSAAVLPVYAVLSTAVVIAVFLMSFRRRYLGSGAAAAAAR